MNENNLDDALLTISKIKNNYISAIKRIYQNSPKLNITDKSKIIIFSDQHRGDGSFIDDFKNREIYKQALEYYYNNGFTLILNGDIEELWKFKLKKILITYSDIYQLEKLFYDNNRYYKLLGNHDDYSIMDSKLLKILYPNLNIMEGLKLIYNKGTIFIFHGHEGGTNDGIFTNFNRFFVNYIWAPIQRIFKINRPTPATNYKLNTTTEEILYDTAIQFDKTIMIAGHTHNFISENNLSKEPCYFNTGCGIYDNRITGIEISNGNIINIEWSPTRKQINFSNIEDILSLC